jgi:hypothetical protein
MYIAISKLSTYKYPTLTTYFHGLEQIGSVDHGRRAVAAVQEDCVVFSGCEGGFDATKEKLA